MQLVFYLPTFNTPCMDHLLYLMFRCDGKFGFCGGFLDLNTPKTTRRGARSAQCRRHDTFLTEVDFLIKKLGLLAAVVQLSYCGWSMVSW